MPTDSALRLTRRDFLVTTASLLTAARTSGPWAQATRPNLLFILADDLGFGDPDYKTINLDRMGSEGIRFLNAYSAASVCTPTRASLVTGLYPARLASALQQPMGFTDDQNGLEPGQPTIASRLKASGYDTALIGKWHLGLAARFSPLRHGFDEFFGILSGGADYYSHSTPGTKVDLHEGLVPSDKVGYLTDLLTERAVEYVARKRDRPFYLSLHYTAPHWPWQGPGDVALDTVGTDNDWTGGGSPRVFGEMVKSMDAGVGKVLTALDRAGVARKTLVVFTSDNGGERYSFNWPNSEHKGTLWEGGIHVPAIARWSGSIPPGGVTGQLAITPDWTATFLGAAGASLASPDRLDGVDLLPIARGQQQAFERTVYWRQPHLGYNGQPPQAAVRRGHWKYLNVNGREYLFDLSVDPGEQVDRRLREPQVLATLKTAFDQWNAGLPKPATEPK